ncbi:hypothetical protein PQO03_21760 [Lentisphaera profundi]|uniref:Ribbon-helix-helix protein CopG domain-containing protein n=1 Tax=Lentisphaera profundi TaxID=1658616 RepID=A0ABY7VZ04_9BACT|nr:hypothetical protein [Lentisphaera profundi]WDE98440.1 hypothetical protein PQO03_21760 [Lentisphaera profundi]
MAGSKRKPLSLAGVRSEEEVDKVLSNLSSSKNELENIVNLSAKSEANKNELSKERVTFYLSSAVLEELENTYDEIRRTMPYKYKTKIKKSHLVEFAMERLLEDYNKNGRDSSLGRYVEAVKRGE